MTMMLMDRQNENITPSTQLLVGKRKKVICHWCTLLFSGVFQPVPLSKQLPCVNANEKSKTAKQD